MIDRRELSRGSAARRDVPRLKMPGWCWSLVLWSALVTASPPTYAAHTPQHEGAASSSVASCSSLSQQASNCGLGRVLAALPKTSNLSQPEKSSSPTKETHEPRLYPTQISTMLEYMHDAMNAALIIIHGSELKKYGVYLVGLLATGIFGWRYHQRKSIGKSDDHLGASDIVLPNTHSSAVVALLAAVIVAIAKGDAAAVVVPETQQGGQQPSESVISVPTFATLPRNCHRSCVGSRARSRSASRFGRTFPQRR